MGLLSSHQISAILDAVINRFGKLPKNEIVNTMHKEDAYTETAPHDIFVSNRRISSIIRPRISFRIRSRIAALSIAEIV